MFNSFIDDCLQSYIELFAVCDHDDILTYSTNDMEHEAHVQNMLRPLQDFGLNYNGKNYQFRVSGIGFLPFLFTFPGIAMESVWIAISGNWAIPESIRDVLVLLGLANFHWLCFRIYSKIKLCFIELLKTTTETAHTPKAPGKTLRKSNNPQLKWERTWEAKLSLWKLRKAITQAPIIQHFDLANLIILQPDQHSFVIAGIVNRFGRFRTQRAVNFYYKNTPLSSGPVTLTIGSFTRSCK